MLFYFAIILVQVCCVVHLIRNGRPQLWLWAIILLPIAGSAAYIVVEVLPGLGQRREVRMAKAAAIRRLDPDRDVRVAREALQVADTAANHTALGDALGEHGDWAQAVVHYRAALAKMPTGDRAAQMKLARALLESDDAEAARRILETLPESASQTETDRAALLLARSLQDTGETDKAREIYARIGPRMAGAEAQCRLAGILIEEGRWQEAVPLLEEAGKRAAKLDKFERARDADMYNWAARTLAELRGR